MARAGDMGTETDGDVSPSTISCLPRWFVIPFVLIGATIVCVGTVALVAAMAAGYSLELALGVGVPVAVVLTVAVVRRITCAPTRTAHLAAAAAVLVAVAFGTINTLYASEQIQVNNDPGVYANTARWIARSGDLRADQLPGAFDIGLGPAASQIDTCSRGFFCDDGKVEPQFAHFFPAVLAVGSSIAPARGLFWGPAALGAFAILAIFAAAAEFFRRAPWALLAAGVTAVALPQIAFTRDTYSEALIQPLLWCFVWVLVLAARSRGRYPLSLAVLAGAFASGVLMTRSDGIVYLLLAPLLGALMIVSADPRARSSAIRFVLVGLGVTAVGLIISTIDVEVFATRYAEINAAYTLRVARVLLVVSLAAGVGLVLCWRRDRLREVIGKGIAAVQRVAVPLGVVATGGLLAAWVIRPYVQTTFKKEHRTLDAFLQGREGVPIQPNRRYAEETVEWMSWYLGPVVVFLAAVGLGLLVFLAVRGKRSAWPLLAITAALFPVFWQPKINPNQLWANRRFVPGAYPTFAILAVLAVAAVTVWLVRRYGRAGFVVPVAAAVLMIATPLLVTRPLIAKSDQRGFLEPMLATCDAVGDDPVIVVGSINQPMTPPFRSWCGSPVVKGMSELEPETIDRLARAWRERGRDLWVVARTADELAQYLPGAQPEFSVAKKNRDAFPISLTRPPEGEYVVGFSLTGARVPVD